MGEGGKRQVTQRYVDSKHAFVSRASWSGGVPEVGAGPSPSPECLQQYVLLCCPSCDLEKHEGPAGLQRSARLASRAPPPGGSVVGGWLAMSFRSVKQLEAAAPFHYQRTRTANQGAHNNEGLQYQGCKWK